jgi:hypothetical protein
MLDVGAPDADIDQYLSTEGVSIDDLKEDVAPVKNNDTAIYSTVGAGAAAAVGGGALAIHAFNAPARQVKLREKELDNIKTKYLQTPYVASSDVPSRIKDKLQTETQPMKSEIVTEQAKLKNANIAAKQASANLKRTLNDFDNQILSKSAKDMADSLLQNQDKFFERTYENYGQVIDLAEEKLTKAGKNIDSQSFIQGVIDKSIQDATAEGLPPDKMGRINSFKAKISQQLESAIIDEESKPFLRNEPITVRQAKGLVRNLSKGSPKELSMALRENWGTFLGQYPDVADDIGSANKDYKEFAKIRRALYKTIDESGKYNPKLLHRMMYSYVKSGTETGLQEMVNLMAKGQGIIDPVPDVGREFSKLEGTKIARTAIQKTGEQTQRGIEKVISESTKRTGDLNVAIEKAREKAIAMGDRAEQLLSEQKNIEVKYPVRSGGVGRLLGKIAGVGRNAAVASVARRSLGAFSIYPMISAAVHGFSDPKKLIADQLGVEMPDRGTKERAVLEKAATRMLGIKVDPNEPTPEELGVTEKEEFEILARFGLGA